MVSEETRKDEAASGSGGDAFVSRYRLRGPLETLPGEVPTPIFRAIERGTGDSFFLYRGNERLAGAPEPTGSLIDPESLLGRARAIAELDHDAFPPLHDYGTLDDGQAYVCWDYDSGETLRARLERSPLELLEAVYVVERVAEALEALHRSGWEHGNLRPGNVFQTALGSIRLPGAALEPADLYLRPSGRPAAPSHNGWAAAAYLAPEQLPALSSEDHDSRPKPDHRADIWALGVLLYECASGRLPFQGRSFEAMARAIRSTLPEPFSPVPGQTPEALDRILEGCLKHDPAARYSSAEALLVDLRALARELEPQMKPRPADRSVSRQAPVNRSPIRPFAAQPEPASFKGLLDHLSERRRSINQEPGPAWWQLYVLPGFLLILLLIVLWLVLGKQ